MKLADVIRRLDADAKGKSRVMMGPLRALAKSLKTDHALALGLWKTGRTDARLLAAMVMDAGQVTAPEAEAMLLDLDDALVVDELTYKVLAGAPCADELAEKWVDARPELTARAGWNLQVARLMGKRMSTRECVDILKKVESRMKKIPVKAQESMMRCLTEIGVRFPEHRPRALDIGERWGVIDDRPVAKGCTPFHAVLWIEALLKRKA